MGVGCEQRQNVKTLTVIKLKVNNFNTFKKLNLTENWPRAFLNLLKKTAALNLENIVMVYLFGVKSRKADNS
jgi:hypothetical protein